MSLGEKNAFARRALLKGIGASSVALVVGNAEVLHLNERAVASVPKPSSEDAFLISAKRTAVIAVPQDNDPLIGVVAERLTEYVRQVTGLRPEVIAPSRLGSVPPSTSAIILSKGPIPYFRPDGYRIATGREQGRSVVNISASAAVGLKYGCYRLIREMRQQSRELHVSALSLGVNPWMKTREIFVADLDWRSPTESEKKTLPEMQKKFDWPNWEIPRLERYVDLMDEMGYNSLMLTDPHALFAFSGGFASSIEEITHKVEAMYLRARRNGMRTAFFMWGQEGTGSITHDYLVAHNNPEMARELADIKAHWETVIDRFGSVVDRWVLHWADPGGCNTRGCTINTPQVMTNEFADLLRQRGFHSDVSFSLWALRWGNDPRSRPWPGYEDWTSVVNSGVLSPDIGICMMRHYSYAQAKAITNQYRKAGVWGWYLNDIETNPGLHVHQYVLENEFRRIDQSASALLDWYSLEDNNHCLNPPTVYMGAQVLWSTETPPLRAMEDFCRAVWGPVASPNVARALEAIGQVRCGTGQHMLDGNLWPDDYMCWFGKGSSSPTHDVALCEKALSELELVKVDAEYVPQMPLVVEPEELLGYVRSHLKYVLDFARIRLAYREALQPALDGRFEETQQKMAALPELPDFIPGVYGAGQETAYYQLLRKFSNTWRGRTFRDNLALGKKVTASSWFNADPRFAPEEAVSGILCEYEKEGWAAGAHGPAWLKIDLGAVETVRSVRIYNRGYKRELWDNNLVATPGRADVFCAVEDPDPSRGTLEDREAGYQRIGGFENWVPTDDPGAYQEIRSRNSVPARFIKVVIYSAANSQPAGCGEVEVRQT
jgi:hypothetical protein